MNPYIRLTIYRILFPNTWPTAGSAISNYSTVGCFGQTYPTKWWTIFSSASRSSTTTLQQQWLHNFPATPTFPIAICIPFNTPSSSHMHQLSLPLSALTWSLPPHIRLSLLFPPALYLINPEKYCVVCASCALIWIMLTAGKCQHRVHPWNWHWSMPLQSFDLFRWI